MSGSTLSTSLHSSLTTHKAFPGRDCHAQLTDEKTEAWRREVAGGELALESGSPSLTLWPLRAEVREVCWTPE